MASTDLNRPQMTLFIKNENPCGENGECLIDQGGNIHCKCSEDYQGENCSEKITCELFTCLANQICELDTSGKIHLPQNLYKNFKRYLRKTFLH